MTITPPTFEMAPARKRTRLYPDPNTNLGRSWAAAWAELVTAGTEYVDGTELAERSAAVSGVQPVTMVTLFTRAATAGVLERTHKNAESTRGVRKRTFYRVPQV